MNKEMNVGLGNFQRLTGKEIHSDFKNPKGKFVFLND